MRHAPWEGVLDTATVAVAVASRMRKQRRVFLHKDIQTLSQSGEGCEWRTGTDNTI